jgi:NADPH-dependent 2,4-dienoyl-CoA reductase/sulfur reductase-like enzyme
MEMGEALKSRGLDTRIVYRGELPVKKWDPAFSTVVLEELTNNGVTFMAHQSPVAVERGAQTRLSLVTDKEKIDTDIIIFALGVKPETNLAREAGLAVGESGAIRVDSSQRTSREEIFSAGDCCESYHRVSKRWVHIPLGDIANKQGRVAGRNIGGYPLTFLGVVGAQSFKVFGLEVAMTGLDEREAQRSGYAPAGTIIWGRSAAASMGEGHRLGLKLIADKASGKLLGAQAVGQSGAVGRINTLSACLWSGMGLDELGYLDLAYSPPFGGSWDIIHTAAHVLKKQL